MVKSNAANVRQDWLQAAHKSRVESTGRVRCRCGACARGGVIQCGRCYC